MDEKKTIRIGTRPSALAMAQAHEVKRMLERKNRSRRFSLIPIRSHGDEYQSVEIFKKTNVGVFTKAIEKCLLAGQVDLAIHSLKDLPTALHKKLALAAIPKRSDARDVLISRSGYTLQSLPVGAKVGTGSPRRRQQLLRLRPDLQLVNLRGNLDTRVARVLKQKSLDAIVVARAGLLRLKKFLRHSRVISTHEILPAVGQGALAVEGKKNDREILKIAGSIHHRGTEIEVLAERAFLKTLNGGCRVPVGVTTKTLKNIFYMKAAVFSVCSQDSVEGEITAFSRQASSSAKKLARNLLKKGAGRFLTEARRAVVL
jgi:hydroxymethylbilane synthase